jgi:uncharacterized protein YqeY
MSLRERLEEDLKESMRRGDTTRRSVIRYLRSEVHNQEIARRTTLDDDGIVGVLIKQAQQRRESIEAFRSGNRDDLVTKEEAELAIILEYLPEQMSQEELSMLARRAVEEVGATGPQDTGKVMGHLMPQIRGKAEGKTASAIVSDLLKDIAGQNLS